MGFCIMAKLKQNFSINSLPSFFYGFLFYPRNTIIKLLRKKDDFFMGVSLLTLFLAIVFDIISHAVILRSKTVFDFLFGIGAIPYLGAYAGNIFFLIAFWFFFIFFILYKTVAKKMEQRNYALLFVKLIFFSYIPLFFMPAVAVLSLALTSYSNSTLYVILSFIVKVWIAVLQVITIKELFKLKTFTSVILFIIPVIIYYAFLFFRLVSFIMKVGLTFI